ncbi:hypothetical protein [Dawidia soli]|uniref:Uncharacterized protein n=1 Tax=Dawidia soli TaxID=2782352 RepID=A0AAP2DBD6_9BACT|nr:hypothetical protein [Dawidia soli]MBT1688891.1 hypothetical protein [Dawidia soli]
MAIGNYVMMGAGAVALVFGARYVMRLNRLSSELEVVTKVSIYRVTISGIDLRIEVTLKNPSGGSVSVKHPFVKIMHGESTLASSAMKDTDMQIPKFSEVTLDPVILNVGFLPLATSAPALLREYRKTGQLTITARTVTTINNSIPFTKNDSIKLGTGIPA